MKGIAFSLFVICLASCKESAQPSVQKDETQEGRQTPTTQFVSAPSPEKEEVKAPEEPRVRPEPKKYPDSAKPAPPVAEAVEGRGGFVISPISGKIVDVRDIPPGTLVRDPTVTTSDGIFRTPEAVPGEEPPAE